MAVGHRLDPTTWSGKQLQDASPAVSREMWGTFIAAVRGTEVDGICDAGYGERSEDRENSPYSCRVRQWHTRAGTIDLAVPKLRTGSYFPGAAP